MMTPLTSATPRVTANWYFDFVSPFAYLQLEQFDRLPSSLDIALRPVVLGGLLNHWESKGPAEIPEKRRFVYRYAHFRAAELGIPFKMPPEHPFNPIKALRLAVLLDCELHVVREIFRFIWRDGHSPASEQDWLALCRRLGVDNPEDALAAPEVKQRLHDYTNEAIARGVFGVPTFVLGKELYWGEDATRMLLHSIASPEWLTSAEVQRISGLPVGVQRRV